MVRSVIGGRLRVLVPMVSMVVLLSAVAVGGVEGGSAGPGGVAAGSFDDDDDWVHEPSIDALAREGILDGTGCGENLFCPDHPVLRWVMAVWLVRALGEAEPGADRGVSFSDVDGEAWWSPFVERLAGLGVTRGCSADPPRFCPEAVVTRAQMATFLARTLELEPAPPAGFRDTAGNVHEESIDSLAAASITAGCATDPPRFCPDAPVTRAQMATFLVRAFDIVVRPVDDTPRPGRSLTPSSCSGPLPAPRTSPRELIAFSRSGGLASDDSDVLVVATDGSGLRRLTDEFPSRHPAWSPDGESIAFVVDDMIYKSDQFGGNLQQLTGADSLGENPSWSPDGTRIAYSSSREDGLFVMDADGGNLRQIVDHYSEYRPPAWSPDGTRIVFAGSANYEVPESVSAGPVASAGPVGLFASYRIATAIFVVDVDTRRVVRLGDGSGPVWSPDGSRIAYESYPNDNEIWVMNSDGGSPHKIAEGSNPVWSPDGSRIAFTDRDGYFYDSDLWMIDVDGSEPEQLTANDYRDRSPVWSPDSNSILFHRSARGLLVIDVDSKTLRRVTPSDHWDSQLAWSPDGESIAFTRYYETIVNVVNPEDGSSWQLTDEFSSEDPVWSPDGTRIAFTRSARDGARLDQSYIMVADYNGTDLTALTGEDLLAFDPAWSPDGSCITFAGYLKGVAGPFGSSINFETVEDRPGADIFVINVHDASMYQFTDNEGREDANPTWSPDGSRIAFRSSDGVFVIDTGTAIVRAIPDAGGRFAWSPDSKRLAISGHGLILVTSADGTELDTITSEAGGYKNVAWSRDSEHLVFTVQGQDETNRIVIYDLDDGSSQELTTGSYPIWSPDGRSIAFVRDTDMDYRESLFVIDVDGGNLRRLTDDDSDSSCARWSPDSSRIAFSSGREGEIYVIDVDSGVLKQVTETYYKDRCPIWSPAIP